MRTLSERCMQSVQLGESRSMMPDIETLRHPTRSTITRRVSKWCGAYDPHSMPRPAIVMSRVSYERTVP